MKWSQDVMQVKYNLEQGDVWNHHTTCLPVSPTPGKLGRNFWGSVYCSKFSSLCISREPDLLTLKALGQLKIPGALDVSCPP